MSLFSSEIVLAGDITTGEARQKWEQAAVSNARKSKIKGKPLFLHSQKKGKYVLHYYQSYGNDVCDAMFTGEIFDYDGGGCQVTGKVTVSSFMKRFAAVLAVAAFPLAILFGIVLRYVLILFDQSNAYERELIQDFFAVCGAFFVIAGIAVMCLIVDKRRVQSIMEYLNNFIKKENV
jgi:hypothetical protein